MCLAERTRRLSLQCKTNDSSTTPSSSSPSPHSNRRRSMPSTPLFQNSTLRTPRSKLVLLTEGDSPLVSPTATSALQTPETPAPVVMEMSVLDEQEHKLAEQEQSLDDQMWQEKEERLEERRAYFRSHYTPPSHSLSLSPSTHLPVPLSLPPSFLLSLFLPHLICPSLPQIPLYSLFPPLPFSNLFSLSSPSLPCSSFPPSLSLPCLKSSVFLSPSLLPHVLLCSPSSGVNWSG